MAKKVYSVSLNPEIQKHAYKLATYHGYRSLSSLVEELLKNWVESKGEVF